MLANEKKILSCVFVCGIVYYCILLLIWSTLLHVNGVYLYMEMPDMNPNSPSLLAVVILLTSLFYPVAGINKFIRLLYYI